MVPSTARLPSVDPHPLEDWAVGWPRAEFGGGGGIRNLTVGLELADGDVVVVVLDSQELARGAGAGADLRLGGVAAAARSLADGAGGVVGSVADPNLGADEAVRW